MIWYVYIYIYIYTHIYIYLYIYIYIYISAVAGDLRDDAAVSALPPGRVRRASRSEISFDRNEVPFVARRSP